MSLVQSNASPIGRRLRSLALAAGALVACALAPSEDAEAAPNDAYAWGFAWVSPGSSINAAYSYNSGNGVNSYTGSNGAYTVTMPELGVYGGTVQVASYGGAAVRCKVASWGPSGAAQVIQVRCHNTSGALADSPFVVFFNKGATSNQRGAHLYFSGNAVPADYSWNSAGGTNTVTRTSLGHYTANLPGLNFANAGVHVTAYGTSPSYCKIVGWGSGSVYVRCNDTTGAPADSAFVLNYADSTPRSGMIGGHAWIDSATTASASYQTNQNEFQCFAGGAVTVSSFQNVTYPDTFTGPGPFATMALATAYGDDDVFCKVSGWSWASSPSKSVVRNQCFTAAGAPTNARFTSSFMVGSYPGPC
jgi:hypothetical protein